MVPAYHPYQTGKNMPEFVKQQIESGVGRITLNRPAKRNALKRQFIEEIQLGITQLASDPSLRVLVLEAEGEVFCAGMDLGEMQQRAESENGNDQWQRDSEVYADLLTAIYRLPVPTVAVVQGPVLAGGMGLILACDILLASEVAFFMLPEPLRGITAAMVTPLLIHRVGCGPAGYMLLSCERLTADRAMTFGLCHEVCPADQLTQRRDKLIASILAGSPSALAITKRHLDQCSQTAVLSDIKKSIAISAEARETADAREGLAAFLEKRKPAWQPE
ncbi:MAG: enoyl-CoA hydratase-related protein [Mariniblastus sp.]|nr:enoyl-CoA hydratase-related protein [Mariniblastus sp.]